jgi:hypothetical protein
MGPHRPERHSRYGLTELKGGVAASSARRDAADSAGSKGGGGGQACGEELAGRTQRVVGPRVQPPSVGLLVIALATGRVCRVVP